MTLRGGKVRHPDHRLGVGPHLRRVPQPRLQLLPAGPGTLEPVLQGAGLGCGLASVGGGRSTRFADRLKIHCMVEVDVCQIPQRSLHIGEGVIPGLDLCFEVFDHLEQPTVTAAMLFKMVIIDLANRLGARLTPYVATTFPGTPLAHARVLGMPLRSGDEAVFAAIALNKVLATKPAANPGCAVQR